MTGSANYTFVVAAAWRLSPGERPRVLDFGCGLGSVVALGLERGLDMVGADTFSHYPRWREQVPESIRDRLHLIEGALPFADASFDMVVSNQVFEHIADPRAVLPEIRRVLKPDGVFLALFPVRETWYEGHVSLYFAHWMQRRSRLQRAYLKLAHHLGFGSHRQDLSRDQWAAWSADYLERDCFYHRLADVSRWWREAFGEEPRSLAPDLVAHRLGEEPPKGLRRSLYAAIAHVRAGAVLAVTKPSV